METEELIKKYGIDLKKLEDEQEKLTKLISIKDSINFSQPIKIAGIDNSFFGSQIISAVVLLENNEVLYQEYSQQKPKFPYIPGFRAYRELPVMLDAYNKLEEKPDLLFIQGQGIAHPRLGLASHFSIAAEGIPTIGLANSLIGCEQKGEKILKNGKTVGKILQTKQGSKPLFMSPGNNISIETAERITLSLITPPHKTPEPLRLAGKYAKKIVTELSGKKTKDDDI
jgi:deoxyribonuclease V